MSSDLVILLLLWSPDTDAPAYWKGGFPFLEQGTIVGYASETCRLTGIRLHQQFSYVIPICRSPLLSILSTILLGTVQSSRKKFLTDAVTSVHEHCPFGSSSSTSWMECWMKTDTQKSSLLSFSFNSFCRYPLTGMINLLSMSSQYFLFSFFFFGYL